MGKASILIVEDDPGIIEYLDVLLRADGYDTVLAVNGEEAVQKARARTPDIVLLDIMLPKLSGFDVCHILKNDPRLKKSKIIMLTSLTQIGDADKAFELGADDYLTKPFESARLFQKIKKQLADGAPPPPSQSSAPTKDIDAGRPRIQNVEGAGDSRQAGGLTTPPREKAS